MLEFTRDEFKQRFGQSPGELFDLRKILNQKHRIEAMRLPDNKLMRVRAEYGTLSPSASHLKDIIFCLNVGYFIDRGVFKALIQNVIIFDDQTEQDLHKAIAANKQQNWNDN